MNIRINIELIEILLKKNGLFVDLTTVFSNKISKSILHVIDKINFTAILKEINRINKKGMQQDVQSKYNQTVMCPSWIFAEKKVFIWIAIRLLYQRTVERNNTNNYTDIEDEQFIRDINEYFPAQPLEFIAYQLREFEEKQTSRMWSFEQQELLQSIVSCLYPQNTEINWKTIAYTLFLKSERKFYRTFHQIRQKWLNYFDPSIKKGKWTLQQDLQLLQSIQKWGKRWSKISRQIGKSRTQHMVKNRFNSLLKKNREFICSLSEQQTLQLLLQNTKNELMGFTQQNNKNNNNTKTINNIKYTRKMMILKSRKPRSKVKQSMICQSMILTDLKSKSSINGVGYEKFMEDYSYSGQIKVDWSLQDNNLFFRTQPFPESFDEVLNFQYHTDFHEEIDEK